MKFFKYLLLVSIFSILYSCKTHEEKQNLPLHNKKVLILGNSITQHGTYVNFLEYYLRKHHPNDSLNIISIGLSSETASGDSEVKHAFPRPCVHSRLNNALKLIKPDLVLACYGMNDGLYSNLDSTRFSNYKNGILKLKEKVVKTGADIILITPTPFDASRKPVSENSETYSYKQPYAHYNRVLKAYGKWISSIENTKTIDLHSYMNKQLVDLKTEYPDSTFIPDGVHPNTVGHFYMAKKIINDLYPETVINAPTTEIVSSQKDTLYKLVSTRRAIRSNGWLKHVGYIKKDTVKLDNISTTIEKVNALDIKILEVLKN